MGGEGREREGREGEGRCGGSGVKMGETKNKINMENCKRNEEIIKEGEGLSVTMTGGLIAFKPNLQNEGLA